MSVDTTHPPSVSMADLENIEICTGKKHNRKQHLFHRVIYKNLGIAVVLVLFYEIPAKRLIVPLSQNAWWVVMWFLFGYTVRKMSDFFSTMMF